MPPLRQPVVEYVAGATFRGYLPSPPLDRWVQLIWFVDGASDDTCERVLPNGVIELIINLGEPHDVVHDEATWRAQAFRRAWIAGMQTRPLTIASDAMQRSLVGIRFRTGGAAPFLGMPLSEVTDTVIETDGHIGRDILATREQLGEARTHDERLALIEALLHARLQRRPPIDGRAVRAVRAIAASPSHETVGQIAARLGLSHKHLITLFSREIGVGPKMLSRIARFHRVIESVQRAPSVRWTDVAHTHGYADQAHLTNEFRALAGVTPTRYWKARTVDPNHVQLDRAER